MRREDRRVEMNSAKMGQQGLCFVEKLFHERGSEAVAETDMRTKSGEGEDGVK